MAALPLRRVRGFDARTFLVRLWRPNTLETLVTILRGGSVVVSLLCLLACCYIIVTTYFSLQSSILSLENRVAAALDSRELNPSKGQDDLSKTIVSRAIFGSLGATTQPSAVPTVPPQTPLSLTLIGTFVTGGEQSYAIIEDKKKATQDVFLLQQSIFGQATLKAIFEDRVEILRNGSVEILKLDDLGGSGDSGSGSGGITSVGAEEFIVDEAEVDKALENLPLLLTQARAVPYFKDGRAVGLRLFAIKTGSLYEKLGLKNGDILKSINGNSLGDLSQALRLFEQLKQERSIAVTMERDRQDKEFKYQIR